MTAIANDRPLEIDSINPGERRARRIEAALVAAQMAFTEDDRRSATKDLAFCEKQIEAAEGTVDSVLLQRVDNLRAALGLSRRYSPDVVATPAITTTSAIGKITTQNVVAGARSDGSGILVGWWGAGELSRAQILGALDRAGLPRDWAPATQSAHAQAGKAVKTIEHSGRIVRAERNGAKAGVVRGWRARWTVGIGRQDADVGEKFGVVVLTASLIGDELRVESDDATLRDQVEGDYRRRVDGEMYAGTHVTLWLIGTMRSHLGAVKLGGNWYVPRANVAACEKLLGEMAATGWGKDWIGSYDFPALPVSTTKQLVRGLASSLVGEIKEIMNELEEARVAARATGRADIGTRGAASFVARLQEVRPRARALADVLGEAVSDIIVAIDAALAIVTPLTEDVSTRGALIWDEISDR